MRPYSAMFEKALLSKRIMDAKRSERKPAGSNIPASMRKIRGINSDKPEVKTFYVDETWTCLGVRRWEEAPVGVDLDGGGTGAERQSADGYSKRLYILIGPLAMSPLRDGLYQRRRV